MAGKVEMGLAYGIRKRAFAQLQKLSFSYYDRTSSGWLMSRMTSDIARLSDTVAWGMVDIVWGLMMMLAMATLMLIRDWRLALLTLSMVPALILLSVWFEREILERFRRVRKDNSKLTSAFGEGIRGMQTIKSLKGETYFNGEFSRWRARYGVPQCAPE
jgi:ATP-binding cassette subfamily B protein